MWHVWGRPSVPISKVLAVGLYLHPEDMPPLPEAHWKLRLQGLSQECSAFHAAQLPGSEVQWALHGPVRLPFPHDKHADDAEAFYHEACDAALRGAGRTGGLGQPVAASTPDIHNGSFVPDMIVFVLFADWGCEYAWSQGHHEARMVARLTGEAGLGCEDADAADSLPPLAKYYVWGAVLGKPGKLAAAATPAEAPEVLVLRDVTLTGGSRSCFQGLRSLTSLPGLCLPCPPGGSGGGRVGIGVGLVTQEAWLHPELLGSACVVYHEGLGHALGMPHPSVRSKWCVMDLAQYQGVALAGGQVIISQEIKDRMAILGGAATAAEAGALIPSLLNRADKDAALLGCVPVEEVQALLQARAHCAPADTVTPLAAAAVWRALKAAAAATVLRFGLGGGATDGQQRLTARGMAWVACEELPPPPASTPSPGAPGWLAAAAGTGDVQYIAPDCGLLLSGTEGAALSSCCSCCGGSGGRSGAGAGAVAAAAAAPVPGRTLTAPQLWALLGLGPDPAHDLGRHWTEHQLCSLLPPPAARGTAAATASQVLLFRTADYHFQEVLWRPQSRAPGCGVVMLQDLAPASGGSPAVCGACLAAACGTALPASPPLALALLDASRNIAVVLRGGASWYSGNGLSGPFYWFKRGQWMAGTIAL